MLRLVALLTASLSVCAQGVTIANQEAWDDILFARGSSALVVGFPSLLRLAALLRDHPEYRVRLEGSTDGLEARGSSVAKLARARADAVSAFLLKYGAQSAQVEVTSDSASPKAAEATDDSRFASRRVTITVGDGQGKLVSARDTGAGPDPVAARLNDIMNRLDEIARREQDLAARQARFERQLNEIAENVSRPPLLLATPPPPTLPSPDIRQIGRALLLTGQKEPPGYGLYSYILFPAPPANDDQKQRYVQVLKAYLGLGDIARIEAEGRVSPQQLHRSMVPVTRKPRDLTPQDYLDAYDYIRAGLLIENLELKQSAVLRVRGGPYLACVLQPLSEGKSKPRLVQTLDWVPPGDLVNAWFQYFLAKAAAPRDWNATSLYRIALETQTWLENAGTEADQVHQAVIASLFFFNGRSAKTPGK